MRMFFSRLLRIQLPIWLVMPMLGLMLAIGLGSGYFGTLWFKAPSPCPEAPEICASFENFWKTWDLARNEYVDPAAADKDKRLTQVSVKLGVSDGFTTEVLEGLAEGDMIITGVTLPGAAPTAAPGAAPGGASNPFSGRSSMGGSSRGPR